MNDEQRNDEIGVTMSVTMSVTLVIRGVRRYPMSVTSAIEALIVMQENDDLSNVGRYIDILRRIDELVEN